MRSKYLRDRFNTSKEELQKLGNEFTNEALPLLDKLYNLTYWILQDKKSTKKIIQQVFKEAIEDCDITKNEADWQSWIERIWMREIIEFYEGKENDKNTDFSFIENFQMEISSSSTFLTSEAMTKKIVDSLQMLPSILRIPLMMRESAQFDYEKISDLVDIPIGVAATRIFRARKLLFMYLLDKSNLDKIEHLGMTDDPSKLIFKYRDCSCQIDNELPEAQHSTFFLSLQNDQRLMAEFSIQKEVKNLLANLIEKKSDVEAIKAKINKRARKRFSYR